MPGPVLTAPSVPAQDILTHITKKEFDILLAMDQLNLERESWTITAISTPSVIKIH